MLNRSCERITKAENWKSLAPRIGKLVGATVAALVLTIAIASAQELASEGSGSADMAGAPSVGDGTQPIQVNPRAANSPVAGTDAAVGQAIVPPPEGGGLLRDGLAPNQQNTGSFDAAAPSMVSPDLARKLGLSADEFTGLKNRLAGGQITPDDIQQLCLR